MTVFALRCEQLENPLGIDVLRPRLSWKLDSNQRGQKQTAYEILVAGSERALRPGKADLWDSGKVVSEDTLEVYYSGTPLASRRQCFWKVRVWDKEGRVSESKTARWEMGLLQPPIGWQIGLAGRRTAMSRPHHCSGVLLQLTEKSGWPALTSAASATLSFI